MKLNYTFLFVLLVFCFNNALAQNVQTTPAEDSTIMDSTVMVDTTLANQNLTYSTQPDPDSVYKVGNYLFSGKKGLAFDFYKNGHRPKVLHSNGDTLYHDKEYTILANSAEADGDIYKKIKLKYSFDMFKVKNTYSGKMAKPNFKTDPAARMYKTMIKDACANDSITFAGHYTIAEWGCGSGCGGMAVVDRITGRIYFSTNYIPFDTLDGHYGIRYQKDSRLIIVNSFLLDDYPGYSLVAGIYSEQKLGFYIWNGNRFVKLK
jgi:hypothetical protein